MKKEDKTKNQAPENYSEDDFLKDLQKVCDPVNKTDKPKSTSDKT